MHAAPLIERRGADAVLRADLRHLHAGVLLLDDGHDLRFTELAASHQRLLGQGILTEPLFLNESVFRGITIPPASRQYVSTFRTRFCGRSRIISAISTAIWGATECNIGGSCKHYDST